MRVKKFTLRWCVIVVLIMYSFCKEERQVVGIKMQQWHGRKL